MRTSSRSALRALATTAVMGVVCMALLAGTAASAGAETTRGAGSQAQPPDNPVDYAVATFIAWGNGDLDTLSELAAPPVAGFLAARAPDDAEWESPECEGAAGSTYCTWSIPWTQLTLRVANEAASQGEPHAVTEAFFSVAPDRVAIWPFTTAEEAQNTQEQVDQGHSPWLLEPTAVASFYASAVLGWQDATVEPVRPDAYWVTDPVSGTMAELTLTQPVREGEGGIWAVTRAGSVALG
jgi:hypothetical protein